MDRNVEDIFLLSSGFLADFRKDKTKVTPEVKA